MSTFYLDSYPFQVAARGGFRIEYVERAPTVLLHDGTLESAITISRGFRRTFRIITEDEPLADIEALEAFLLQGDRMPFSGDLLAGEVQVLAAQVERRVARNRMYAALSFILVEAGTIVGGDRQELVRIQITDSGGTLQDFSDWFIRGQVTASLESFARTANLTFLREKAGESLVLASPLPIAPGRRVKMDVAVIDIGATPSAGDWDPVFRGWVDDRGWGGDQAELVIPCRDLAGRLHDTWIEDEKEYGDNTTLPAIEVEMQSLIDDTMGSDGFTMITVGDPDFGIRLYTQSRESLETALFEFRDLIGWDLRALWNASSSDYELTFYEPPRDKITPDYTLTESDYFQITRLEEVSSGVRNKVEVDYSSEAPSIIVLDSGSIGKYGVRYARLDETQNSQINTEAKATALGIAFLDDTAEPLVDHQAENILRPDLELNDILRYPANGVHFDSDQDIAVTSFTHVFDPSGNMTLVEGRVERPRGPAYRWLRKQKEAEEKKRLEELLDIDPTTEDLAASDIKFYYTTSAGSSGYSNPGTPAGSLGGYSSTTEVTEALNELWRQITVAERSAGITLYRTIFLANRNASPVPKDFECVLGWLSTSGESGLYTYEVAIDPVGIVDLDGTTASSISADEETEPTSLDWVSPTSSSDPDVLDIGTIAPGEGVYVHLKLTVEAGSSPVGIAEMYLVVQNRVPLTISGTA